MAVNSRRIRIVLIVVVCVIILTSVVGFFVIPGVIERKVNAMLEQAEAKTGRHIEMSDISLRGFKSVAVRRVTISDIDHPERTGVAFDDVLISLSGLPVGDFSIASVNVDNLEITVRKSGDATNFEDVLNKLRKKEDDVSTETKEAPAWKKYLTPFPEIGITEVSVTMPTMKVGSSVEIGAVSADHLLVNQDDDGMYHVESGVSALLVEKGTPTTYRSSVSGQLLNGHEGTISVTVPQSEKKTVPEVLQKLSVGFDTLRIVLPTTIEIDGLSVTPEGKHLFSAEKTRARLMTLPPTKVAGVYLKEIEVVKPEIHDYIGPDGSYLVKWAKDAATSLGVIENSGDGIPKKIGEAAAEVAAAAAGAALKAAAEGSENVGQAAADAALKNVAEQVKFNPRDYFFSQRMFITDGAVSVEDLNNGIASFDMKDIELEVGYRSIRHVLDYRLEFGLSEPVSTSIELSGQYDLPAEDLKGRLVIHPLKSGKTLKTVQAVIQEKNAKVGVLPPMLANMIPSVEFDNTVFEAKVDYHFNQKQSQLDIDSFLNLNNFVLRQDRISREPTSISGSLGMSMTANFADQTFEIKTVDLKTSGADIHLGVKLDKVPRPQKKGAKTTLSDKFFTVNVDVPTQKMQVLFEAIPHSLRTELDGLAWSGTLGLRFSASGYLDSISDAQHKFTIVPSPDFEITGWPKERNIWALNTGFTYNVQDPNALNPHSIAIPPSIYPIEHNGIMAYIPRVTAQDIHSNYRDWVLFDDLNPWLVQLITTTEDGSFFSHEGFSPMQVKSAIERNLNRQAFARGASTISMQLVKNLFFERSKTISRKFQEVLYTWLMESILKIPKKRIMELYFNIIEFGPEIYGVEEAAKYYFGKRSIDLSLKESAYLMAIIPSPRRGASHRSKEKLDAWLQKTMSFYIREMYRRKCDQAVLASRRARLAKQGKSMVFEPCCPPRDSLQLMLDGDTLSFYIPNPDNPQEYGYRPDMYTPDGTPLVPRKAMNCGRESEELEEAESIFEPFQPANSMIP